MKLLFAFVALLAPLAPAQEPAPAPPPNVVLIIADDQGWGDFGFMGHPRIRTPNIDRLAEQSLVFTRGYVPSSLCRPSLATIITGLYPHQHGITGNDPHFDLAPGVKRYGTAGRSERARLDAALQRRMALHATLPRLLARRGYLSMQSGKWWEGSWRNGGFTCGMTHGDPARGGRHGDAGLAIGRKGMEPVLAFIDEAVAKERPFFLWYAPMLPHAPHDPPERILARYRRGAASEAVARYQANCEFFDETCGELLGHLERRGIGASTLVLFLSDNGWIQDPRRPNRYAPRSKRSPNEGGIRTPILVRWPGHVAASIDGTTLAGSIDLAPTILAACGLERGAEMKGIDLLDEEARAARAAICGEIYPHDIGDLERPTAGLLYRWIIAGWWKLIAPRPGAAPGKSPDQLYDLRADPAEEHDLAAQRPEVAARLRGELDAWWRPPPQRAQAPAPRRPNILFFLSDDQRADLMGCAGHPFLKTPAMDRLAAQGVLFRNAFVTTSICAASRASIFTGLHERTHRFTFGTPPLAARWTRTSYPRLLRAAGYRTGFIGKLGVKLSAGERERMFDSFVPLGRSPYFHRQPDGSLRHESELAGDRAIEFLRGCEPGRPFCLSISFNAPHAEDGDKEHHYPWPHAVDGLYRDVVIPPPRLGAAAIFAAQPDFLKRSLNRERFFWRWDTPAKWQRNARAYFRMISGVDGVMARVLTELERLGQAERTVVIFSSDNGYYLGARGFAGKWSHYEQSLRVPLIIRDPRIEARLRGRTVDAMALNIDIPATILACAGLQQPPPYQGRSLLPWVRGSDPATWRADFFCEHLMNHPKIPKWEGVRGLRWKYARYFEQDPPYEFLHDLRADPDELRNLAADPRCAAELARLRARCDELRESYEEPHRAGATPRESHGGKRGR